jgi:lipopolysaccharide transport system ATP-binding protein
MSIAISVENLSKAYRIGKQVESSGSLVGSLLSLAAAPIRNFRQLASLDTFGKLREEESLHWALRDVSFEVKEGDVIGIIGRNGAGKSTLLKILSRITQPTRGRAVLRGRVSSLLEVGTGFHQELSGRENVYMNGTILGMKKREIDRKFDEIVAFSGIEKFLDTPVKRYSSGMKVRLAFAVAAHLEPEILIIDEVLAVGDFEFQRKCIGKMSEVANSGRTVLFVSHNTSAVEALCNRCIHIANGSVKLDGNTAEILSDYMKGLTSFRAFQRTEGVLRAASTYDENGVETSTWPVGTDGRIELELIPERPYDDAIIAIRLKNSLGVLVVSCISRHQHHEAIPIRLPTKVTCNIRDVRLIPGTYSISVQIGTTRTTLAEHEDILSIEITPRDLFGTGLLPKPQNAMYLPDADWSFQNLENATASFSQADMGNEQ